MIELNLILNAAVGILKTMTLKKYCDLRHPIMIHYPGPIKPWKQELEFYTFDLWRKYAKETGLF